MLQSPTQYTYLCFFYSAHSTNCDNIKTYLIISLLERREWVENLYTPHAVMGQYEPCFIGFFWNSASIDLPLPLTTMLVVLLYCNLCFIYTYGLKILSSSVLINLLATQSSLSYCNADHFLVEFTLICLFSSNFRGSASPHVHLPTEAYSNICQRCSMIASRLHYWNFIWRYIPHLQNGVFPSTRFYIRWAVTCVTVSYLTPFVNPDFVGSGTPSITNISSNKFIAEQNLKINHQELGFELPS